MLVHYFAAFIGLATAASVLEPTPVGASSTRCTTCLHGNPSQLVSPRIARPEDHPVAEVLNDADWNANQTASALNDGTSGVASGVERDIDSVERHVNDAASTLAESTTESTTKADNVMNDPEQHVNHAVSAIEAAPSEAVEEVGDKSKDGEQHLEDAADDIEDFPSNAKNEAAGKFVGARDHWATIVISDQALHIDKEDDKITMDSKVLKLEEMKGTLDHTDAKMRVWVNDHLFTIDLDQDPPQAEVVGHSRTKNEDDDNQTTVATKSGKRALSGLLARHIVIHDGVLASEALLSITIGGHAFTMRKHSDQVSIEQEATATDALSAASLDTFQVVVDDTTFNVTPVFGTALIQTTTGGTGAEATSTAQSLKPLVTSLLDLPSSSNTAADATSTWSADDASATEDSSSSSAVQKRAHISATPPITVAGPSGQVATLSHLSGGGWNTVTPSATAVASRALPSSLAVSKYVSTTLTTMVACRQSSTAVTASFTEAVLLLPGTAGVASSLGRL